MPAVQAQSPAEFKTTVPQGGVGGGDFEALSTWCTKSKAHKDPWKNKNTQSWAKQICKSGLACAVQKTSAQTSLSGIMKQMECQVKKNSIKLTANKYTVACSEVNTTG
jgi:hypothetical protein